jgi:hypothetical protein
MFLWSQSLHIWQIHWVFCLIKFSYIIINEKFHPALKVRSIQHSNKRFLLSSSHYKCNSIELFFCKKLPLPVSIAVLKVAWSQRVSLFPLPRKAAKALPWAENLNFPPITVNNLPTQIDLALFIRNRTKIKLPFEIKPPLSSCFFGIKFNVRIRKNTKLSLECISTSKGKDLCRNGRNALCCS